MNPRGLMVIVGAIVAALLVLTPGAASASAPAKAAVVALGATQTDGVQILGTPDQAAFEGYCQRHGNKRYVAGSDAFGARCDGEHIAMTTLCREQYRAENAYERIFEFYHRTHEGAWQCFKGGNQIGGADLSRLCTTPPLSYREAVLRGNTANDWWCTGGSQPDLRIERANFDRACEITHSWGAIVRLDWNNPHGSMCWR